MANILTLEDSIFNSQTLSQQLEEENETEVFNPLSEVETIKSQELAIAINGDENEIRAARANGDTNHTSVAVLEGGGFDYNLAIDQAYNDGMKPEDIAEVIQNRKDKGEDMGLPEYVLMQNLMLSDNDINPYAARTLTNMETWNRLIQKEMEENDQTGLSKVATFLDVNIFREISLGAFENVTLRSNREGVEIREAFTGLKPSEFEEWAKEYVKERKNEGIFSRDSIWNLHKAASDALYLGNDPMAGPNALFGVADIATLGYLKGATALTSTLKAGTKSSVANKILSLTKVRRPVDAVSVIKGEVEAANVLAKSVDDMGIQVDEISAGRNLPKELDPTQGPSSRPSGVALRQNNRKTVLFEKLEEMNRRGSFGEYVSASTIAKAADDIAVDIANNTNDVVVDSKKILDEGSDDYKVVVRMGKNGSGAPFRLKQDAEAIAEADPSLYVVKREEGDGWYVETEQRVDILKLPEATDRFDYGNIVSDSMDKVLGHATGRLGYKIGGKFMQAEAGQALVGELLNPYLKKLNKVKKGEQENISDFMTQLRDGELSHLRKAPTKESFASLYKTMYGSVPSQKAIDAYDALIDINDTTWHIKSSARLKRTVAEGGVYADFTDEYSDIVYRATLPNDELALDFATGRSISKTELSSDQIVFKVPNTFMDHLYVTNVKSTRVLERVDVMPYNIGGPRTNSEFKWFVGTTKEQTLVSNNTYNSTFKTLLGSFGKEQAQTAVLQVNNITRKVKELMDIQGVDDISKLALSKPEYDELGALIRQNNSWNKNVFDYEDLVKLADEYGFRFTEKFVAKARDEKISIVDQGEDISLSGATYGEVVGTRLNTKRGDKPLLEFGGSRAVNASPVAAIADQFGSEAFGYVNRAASQNAIVGWVGLAEKNPNIVQFPKGVPESDYLNRFLEAKVTKSGVFNDTASQLREQQDIIKRRLNQPTWLSDKWESYSGSVAEFVFEKSGKKFDVSKADPSATLMKVGFYSKFGFLNPDQLLLQSLHSLTIVGISPIQGSRALGLTPSLLLAFGFPVGPTRSLLLKRLANSRIISEEDLTGLIKYIDESGRNIIDTNILELQSPQKFGVATTIVGKGKENLNKFLDYSTLFFKEGERFTRLAGITTAFLEHRVKRPLIDPNSAEGKLWITNREHDLGYRMGTASRSFAQSGPMKVPTQWLSFSLRAMMNIVVGRNFTAGERIGMFAVMGPMLGLTGLGLGKSAGYVTEKLGYDPQDPETVKMFNRIKYGAIDALLSNLLDTETAYATRIAPADQLVDTYRKLFDDEFMTVIAGPSGEITRDMYQVAVTAFGYMFKGQGSLAREDLTQLLRNLSTVDKVVKIKELIETGNYRSRTRKLSVGGLGLKDALAVGMGATPAPVQNFYDLNEMIYKENKVVRDFEKRMRAKSDYAIRLLTDGSKDDMLKGKKLFEEVNDELWAQPFSNEIKVDIQRRLARGEVLLDFMRNARRLGLEHDAQTFQQQR
jgi:hypothetical protein